MTQSGFQLNRKALFGIMVLIAAGAMPVQAATITVTTTNDVIANDGFCSLREAVIAANTNAPSGVAVGECAAGELAPLVDVISLPANIQPYTLSLSGVDEVEDPATVGVLDVLNSPNTTIGDLDITESVTIMGAGSAATTIQWDPVIADDNRDRIFHVNAPTGTVNVTIQGVKLTHGQTKEDDLGVGPASGLGPLPTNYWLRRAGGALAVGPAAAVVLVDPNVTGSANSAGQGGSNKPGDEGETGATITFTLTDVIVDDNQAAGDGGGIYTAAAMTANSIIVSNNEALTNGGGVYNEGNTSITNSTLRGNIAEGGGGVFLTGSNTVRIKASTLSGNRAVGGGAVAGRADVTIDMVNSTISGNLAEDVGAGLYTNGIASLRFVTIANNITGAESSTAGAGINTFPSGAVAVTLKNVLLAANKKGWEFATYANPADDPTLSAANCGSTDPVMMITSNGYNLSSDTTCTTLDLATDLNNVDPLIGILASNGGPTQTHALLAGSPALSAGGAELDVTVDQRGQPRESPPDIGAYERDNIVNGGGGGGGCAVGGDGRLDPTLPAMLAAALAVFGWRRRAAK